MTDSIRESLEKLKTIAPKVNLVADEATKAVRAVEQALADLNLSTPACVNVDKLQKTKTKEERRWLEYRRHEGKFRVLIVLEEVNEFADSYNVLQNSFREVSATPWLESHREDKLATFGKLPELVKAVVQNVIDSMNGANKTIAEVEDLLKSLR